MTDPYENKAKLGAMIRWACTVAIHDEVRMPEVKRLNDIQVCEAFVTALADEGAMITRIPRRDDYVECHAAEHLMYGQIGAFCPCVSDEQITDRMMRQ